MAGLINVNTEPIDANDGRVTKLDYPIGNRTFGQRVFLSGQEQVLLTNDRPVAWGEFESITVSSSVVSLNSSYAAGADTVLITSESNAIRYRVDGLDPSASVGHTMVAGGGVELEGFWEISQFRAIRRDASDATLRVTYGTKRDA